MNALRVLLTALLVTTPALAVASGASTPPFVPEVVAGYALAPLTVLPAATSIAFGPDGDLYATVLTGQVLRVPLTWTPAGPVAGAPSTVAAGFSLPLGLAFHGDDLYVSDTTDGAESGRVDGRVTRLAEGERAVVVSGLPNGRHNTNNLRMGPDGRLYVTNGNPNDNGVDGGEADVHPYSGAILSFDPAVIAASPAVLHWRDAAGAPIAVEDIPTHPRNADFASKVQVLGYGFRNVYDVAFGPTGHAYTAMNGADEPSSQDAFYRITPGADHGFPFCFNEGEPGAVGAGVSVAPSPVYGDASRCEGVPPADALLGWHVCATGLDVPPAGSPFGHAAFVGECGPFFPEPTRKGVSTHDTGHKVVRVALDDDGRATEVRDFITGLHLPTDVVFGPDGALYVADVDAAYRVVKLPAPLAATAGVDAVALAAPGSAFAGYATPLLVVPVGAGLSFRNYDLVPHNLVAVDHRPDDDRPWCLAFPGRCPLFWSPTIGTLGEASVLGLEDLQAGRAYAFQCTIHPAMRGQLVLAG